MRPFLMRVRSFCCRHFGIIDGNQIVLQLHTSHRFDCMKIDYQIGENGGKVFFVQIIRDKLFLADVQFGSKINTHPFPQKLSLNDL